MIAATYAKPHAEHRTSKLDDALDRGFVPHPDDMLPPAQHLLPGEGVDALTGFCKGVRAMHFIGPLTRCAHPHCRTSVTEESVSYCPHDLPFCPECVWEDGCDECANSQPIDYGKAS